MELISQKYEKVEEDFLVIRVIEENSEIKMLAKKVTSSIWGNSVIELKTLEPKIRNFLRVRTIKARSPKKRIEKNQELYHLKLKLPLKNLTQTEDFTVIEKLKGKFLMKDLILDEGVEKYKINQDRSVCLVNPIFDNALLEFSILGLL